MGSACDSSTSVKPVRNRIHCRNTSGFMSAHILWLAERSASSARAPGRADNHFGIIERVVQVASVGTSDARALRGELCRHWQPALGSAYTRFWESLGQEGMRADDSQYERKGWHAEAVFPPDVRFMTLVDNRRQWGRRLRTGATSCSVISTGRRCSGATTCSQSQLTAGKKTWLYKLPKLPPILVPPPEAQIRPFTKAAPYTP